MGKADRNAAREIEHKRLQEIGVGVPEGRRSRPLIYALSKLLVTLAYAIFVSMILNLIVQSFVISGEIGIKSLAAGTLPPLLITYVTLYNRSFRPPQHIPEGLLFVIFTVWMVAVLVMINYLNTNPNVGTPIGVLILSTTLSILVFLNKHINFAGTLSCAFGVVTGFLVYALMFGISIG